MPPPFTGRSALNAPSDPRGRAAAGRRRPGIAPAFATHVEAIAGALSERGHVFVPDFVSAAFIDALRTETAAARALGAFRPAGVGRGATWQHRPELRGDEVLWVDPQHPSREQARLLRLMERLRTALNRRLFLGLTSYEAHLAVYPPGSAYVRHRDQHERSDARVVTTTLYLNPDWAPGDGGALRLYVDGDDAIDVPPLGGLLGIFLSQEFEHEVLPAVRERMSWTGWFRREVASF